MLYVLAHVSMNKFLRHTQSLTSADVGVLMILLGAVCAGLRPLFGRWLINDDMTAVIIALYTFVASTILFLPGGLRDVQHVRQQRRTAAIGIGCGVGVGLGGLAYFEALQRLPVATVTMIYFTYPVMVIAAVALLRRRWPQPAAWLAMACVLVGCSLIIGLNRQELRSSVLDIAIAFVSPVSWALLLISLAGPLTWLSPWSRIGFIASGATLAMLAVVFVWQPANFLPQTPIGWLGVLGLVVVSGILTHVLFTLGVPQAGPDRASIAGVFEVATALAVGWVVFLEPITLSQCAGIALIVAALLLTRRLETGVGGTA